MKKVHLNSKLSFKKSKVSNLKIKSINGGYKRNQTFAGACVTVFCATNGALNSCPPPGHFCL